ncbi:MAG TPA: MvaI/BcnI family restriction endonuclease [Steroidobacteraceae bacterium]|jgi:hypothetical protein|nr:MvaI/BcnI family restriction endonuclease [Steroidobacteraceae bacterium]
MSLATLDQLLRRLSDLGAHRILCKRLAENDNSKQQIYLGPGFESLNLIPYGAVKSDRSTRQPTLKASLSLSWLDDEGRVARAPNAQLILYPNYPEVRMSGFLRGCLLAPSKFMRPVPRAARRFNNGPDGRLLFLAVLGTRELIAYLAPEGSAVAAEFDRRARRTSLQEVGLFLDVPLPGVGDSRARLLAQLREICADGWHASRRLYPDGITRPYVALNGGGYTLEALFGVVPNGRAEPDFLGWELKACGSDRITLMTPEPDSGYYGKHGVEAFVRKYGHERSDDTLYFTGTHRADQVCEPTGQRLTVRGFRRSDNKIVSVDGGIDLIDPDGEVSAGWSFGRLLEHWGRKHAAAAYVPYDTQDAPRAYRYTSPALLGEGTSFVRFLAALIAGEVIYDPGPKVTGASTTRPKTKARSQFRIRKKSLSLLYDRFGAEPID